MLSHLLVKRLSYANVVSTLCLFIVLGGSAYAAASITGRDVKNGSLTGADVKDHPLRSRDFEAGELPAGPAGPKGDPGRDGAPGVKGDPGPNVVAPPAASRQPAGRLALPGITGAGPGGTIEVRSLAWANVLSGDAFGGGLGAPKAIWGTSSSPRLPTGARRSYGSGRRPACTCPRGSSSCSPPARTLRTRPTCSRT